MPRLVPNLHVQNRRLVEVESLILQHHVAYRPRSRARNKLHDAVERGHERRQLRVRPPPRGIDDSRRRTLARWLVGRGGGVRSHVTTIHLFSKNALVESHLAHTSWPGWQWFVELPVAVNKASVLALAEPVPCNLVHVRHEPGTLVHDGVLTNERLPQVPLRGNRFEPLGCPSACCSASSRTSPGVRVGVFLSHS